MSPWSPALCTSGSTGWSVQRTLGVCFNPGPTWNLWGVCSRFRIWVSNGDSYPLSGKVNYFSFVRLRFVIGVKISRHFLHQSKGEPSQMVTELSLTFFLQKVFSYFTWQFFLSPLQEALSGGVMKVSCFVCAINPQPCQFSLLFATLEPRRKLDPVNFRKEFWYCY